ncbi:MAG: tRNA pseudouridine(55) synthase TruB [Chloroflexota bacterium]
MPKRENRFHGILVIDKPGLVHNNKNERLYTSHDVVQIVRRLYRQRRVGHTGTLDPLASGLMVICLGNATRLVEYYQGYPKQYYAEIVLGAATDTYDAVGEITARSSVPPLTEETLQQALDQFRGDILQMPPVYSAIKQGGESVHRKARRGESVELTPRPVTFYQLDLIRYTEQENDAVSCKAGASQDGETQSSYARVVLRARCSAGTYIRSLAHDLGNALGTHGYLDVLRRESVGSFTLENAHTLDELEKAVQETKKQGAEGQSDDDTRVPLTACLEQFLLPMGIALTLPIVTVDAEMAQRFGYGQKVSLPFICFDESFGPIKTGMLAQARQGVDTGSQDVVRTLNEDGEQGQFLGVIRCLSYSKAENAGSVKSVESTSDSQADPVEPVDSTEDHTNKHSTSKAAGTSIWKAEKWFG